MPGLLLVLLLPFHLLMNLGMLFLSCFRKQGRVVLRAKVDAFTNLGMVLGKRKTVQKQRSVSLLSLVKVMDWNPFSPAKKLLKK